jgi:hypothetical protein
MGEGRLTLRTVIAWSGLVLFVLINLLLIRATDWTMLTATPGADWQIFVESSARAFGGDLYAVEADYAFRYSPFVAYAFGVIQHIGPDAWRIAHLAALALLPERRVALAALISWPFWFDVAAGNVMTFVLVLAAAALAGSRWATAGFLVLSILIPRPLMVPIAFWLLWKRPDWRVPFAAMFVIHGAAVALTGWGLPWAVALIGSGAEMESILNFGPSRLVGSLWMPIGIGLAAILTWRGHLGWASLLASPYWLPYYFMMPFLELSMRRRRQLAEET